VLALSQRKQVHRSNDDGLELDAKRVDLLREAVPGLTRARLLTSGSRGSSNPRGAALAQELRVDFTRGCPPAIWQAPQRQRRRVGRALAARRGGAGVEPTACTIIPADAGARGAISSVLRG
jgi:hypothetical protein